MEAFVVTQVALWWMLPTIELNFRHWVFPGFLQFEWQSGFACVHWSD